MAIGNSTTVTKRYCANDNRWFLYTGDRLDACNLAEENKLAYSGKTYTFDIASSFGESWASRTGAPLGLYFFKEVELNDESCNAFLGDGICNTNFNTLGYGFDSGDCCAATCNGPECGFGAMEKAFDTVIGGGDGYPDCKGPDMVPITIYLNNVYLNDVLYREDTYDNFATQIVRDALMTLDCDGSNVLLVPINEAMTNKTETVMVTDGASCSMMIKNVTSHYDDVWFVDYTIYHGDKNSIEIDPIVIKTGSSFEKEVTKFQRIPNCFFTKLSDFINKTTIYTGADPSNQAIDWLLEDSSGFSKCERRNFIERYALAVINFAAPIYKDDVVDGNGLWISTGRQCAWKNVICVSGNVTTLSVGADSGISLKGTMAPEIALLKNLTELDMSQNDLRGTISPEIGECKNLRTINIEKNNFTGTIPSEIAQLTGLKWFFCGTNSITGTIPTIFAEISSLLVLTMHENQLTGTLPDEIGSLSNLQHVAFAGNLLTGSIPSIYGDLQDLKELWLSWNFITGTIPTELGKLQNLKKMKFANNKLTGSIPKEILDIKGNITDFDVYGNQLSGLIPVEGDAVCSAEGGEHYCNCNMDCFHDQNLCGCDEAESCCASFLEQLTECKMCGNNGFQNPDFFVEEFGVTCSDAAYYIKENIALFGTDKQCEKAKVIATKSGCFCHGEDPNANTPYLSFRDAEEIVL